jgi:cellulose synthase/poly-beta-1,6-N-acetylglucosamine synthase-like glycosyltransferase
MSQTPDHTTPDLEERTYKVALLIPAHNEEECIQHTILSVLKQTACTLPNVQVDVFIIADNCTDRTEEAVLALMEGLKGQEKEHVFLLRSEQNKSRKAGALNQGYLKIRASGYTHIATADADTVWDPQFLEHGLAAMAKHQEALGGVCGRAGLLPYQKDPFKPVAGIRKSAFFMFVSVLLECFQRIIWALRQVWKYAWWSFQNIEYSLAQSETIEHMGKAHCLCGPGSLYRTEVLDELYARFGLVWPETMVEDFDLTVRIQSMKESVSQLMKKG